MSSGWESKPRMTQPAQTEEPHIDGTDSRRQAPLPCESHQLKRGHGAAVRGRGFGGEKPGKQRVKGRKCGEIQPNGVRETHHWHL